MPLNDYTPTYRDVVSEAGRELGTVRGLSLNDIHALATDYLKSADQLAGVASQLLKATHGGDMLGALSDGAIQDCLLKAIQDAPDLIVGIIIRGGDFDEEEGRDLVRRMPMGIQILIVEQIFDATFEEVGGVKKFWSVLATLVMKLVPQENLQAVKAP